MTRAYFRIYALTFTFLSILMLAFPSVLSAQEQARKAEEQRQAEIRQREKIAGKRAIHLAKAEGVLRLYKKGAPAKHNFSGYEQQEALQNIYTGNFEQFTAGYDSEYLENADAKNAVLMFRSMAGDETAAVELKEMMAVARRRVLIRLVYLAYHEVYAEQCSLNMEISWDAPVAQRRSVSLPVRQPFSKSYLSIYDAMGEGGELVAGMPPATKQEFQRDSRKLLKTQGCSSPVVRQFEINLYLATEWLLPLHELLPYLVASQSSQQAKQIPKTQNTKTPARRAGRKPQGRAQTSNSTAKSAPQGASSEARSSTTPATPQRFQISNRLPTDFQVRRGDQVTITADGTITVGVFAGSATPAGISGFKDYSIESQFPHGSLLVRVRQYQNDAWVFCGSSCSFTAERDGYLDFVVNDIDFANNSGNYQILVRVDKKR